jgi:hypothetical protein
LTNGNRIPSAAEPQPKNCHEGSQRSQKMKRGDSCLRVLCVPLRRFSCQENKDLGDCGMTNDGDLLRRLLHEAWKVRADTRLQAGQSVSLADYGLPADFVPGFTFKLGQISTGNTSNIG